MRKKRRVHLLFDDILNHGIDVVSWLQNNGEPELARRLLDEVRSVWLTQFVSKDSTLPSQVALALNQGGPGVLIARGKEAARAGDHDQAFHLFGVANEILSYYALNATQERMSALKKEAEQMEANKDDPAKQQALQSAITFSRLIARGFQYSNLKSIYDQMREIYGFYSVLEKEALSAGDAKGAAVARVKASELHKDPEKKFHDDAWTHYLAAVDWGLRLDIPPDVQKLEKTDPDAYAQKARYEKFYGDQEIFDKGAKELDLQVNLLAPVRGDAAKLMAALNDVVDKASALAVLFTQIGPNVGVNAGSAISARDIWKGCNCIHFLGWNVL